MFHEQDYDEERLRADTILFWGTVGPQTGLAVVLADSPRDLIQWLRERSRVEGRSSHLSRALISVERAFARAGSDPDLAADAIGSALDEAGIPFHACGPILRELVENETVRVQLWEDAPTELEHGGVMRGGEARSDVEGSSSVPSEGEVDEASVYQMDEDVEDLAEHVEIDFERADHREYLIERLEALKTPPANRRAA